ncbi:uncharacterized protein CANTADRAFT_7600 [Suhomyces tanzawaensis NRRL Y-17324]|uniref:Uncharacterized protein n=1 Tax=Suhomyces tanzawaensis NRRL Y-17324 TaxID=984487 RepID=A0A1E4SF81_9ASCO|nr:uncharacterized protein CANTADRAFT_7600 [Suhomyces tanzawaensis NRRL Y-17324]ODV78148.1 hypothetical protein CANTADRAFT_7600 [Suhomyces tanzawaensis NRRL Y-17324]
MASGDDTIARVRHKNSVLRERLSRLINEDEDLKERKSPAQSQDHHRSDDKENRQRYFQSLKENVEHLKKKQYELPGTKQESHVRAYVASDRSLDESFDTDPLESELSPEQEVIARLRDQLRLQAAERKELIEEFQRKEATMFKEYRHKESQLRKELEQVKLDQGRDHHQLEDKYTSLVARLQRENSDHRANEASLNHTLKKISVKVVMYKRQLQEMTTKNEALQSVNKILTRSLQVVHVDCTDDDTAKLMTASDTTTEVLIRGYNGPPAREGRPRLARYAAMVLFVVRVRRMAEARKTVERRLQLLVADLHGAV